MILEFSTILIIPQVHTALLVIKSKFSHKFYLDTWPLIARTKYSIMKLSSDQ